MMAISQAIYEIRHQQKEKKKKETLATKENGRMAIYWNYFSRSKQR